MTVNPATDRIDFLLDILNSRGKRLPSDWLAAVPDDTSRSSEGASAQGAEQTLLLFQLSEALNVVRQGLRIEIAERGMRQRRYRAIELLNGPRMSDDGVPEIPTTVATVEIAAMVLRIQYRQRFACGYRRCLHLADDEVARHALSQLLSVGENAPRATAIDCRCHVHALGILLAIAVRGMRSPHLRRCCDCRFEHSSRLSGC